MFFSQLKRDHIYDEKTKTITITQYSIEEKDYSLLESLDITGAVIYGRTVNLEILKHLPKQLKALSLIDSSINSQAVSSLKRYSELEYLRLNSQTVTQQDLANFPHFPKLKFLNLELPKADVSELDFSAQLPKDCELSWRLKN